MRRRRGSGPPPIDLGPWNRRGSPPPRSMRRRSRHMTYVVDPERRELTALARIAPWRGRRVIELGCGDGRLTLRLAALGAQVLAIDPDAECIRAARLSLPERFADRVR